MTVSKKPSKEELERLYIHERKTTYEIGEIYNMCGTTITLLLRKNNIQIRSKSEATRVRHNKEIPSKSELERLYIDEHKTAKEIGKIYKTSGTTITLLLRKNNIPIRTQPKYITNTSQFSAFIKQDEKARNLAASALALNGSGGIIEQALLELYKDKFKGKKDLHNLVQESKEEIYSLVRNGLTNLGPYLGAFSLEDRRMAPVLVGNALDAIPIEKATPSLEEMFTYLGRNSYGPSFNESPEETMNQLEIKINQSNGFAKAVYQRTLQHYQDTLKLREELN